MTITEKLRMIDKETAKENFDWHRPFSRNSALGWLVSGRMECSPTQASGILHSDPYRMVVEARYLRDKGQDRIGGVRFRFSGRNLRLSVIDLLSLCGWEKADLMQLMEARP